MTPPTRMPHLERPEELLHASDVLAEPWADVHLAVQDQLVRLEAKVRQLVTDVAVEGGFTAGTAFALFSHRTFSQRGSDVDPVVAGVTFLSSPAGVTVQGDISGEQTGDIIAAVPARAVGSSREELLAAAHDSAGELCNSAAAIAAALIDPSRAVE